MKQRSKLTQEQQQGEQHAAAQETRQQQGSREFATSEEMLRHDAGGTEVPPRIAERLKQSIRDLAPPPKPSWWKNLFSK